MPLEEMGPPLGYKVTVEPGVKTPFKTIVSGGQQLIMGGETLPKMTVSAIPKAAYLEKELLKQATRGAVQLVSKPSVGAKMFPFVGMAARGLPKAWQPEPYPGTKKRVREDVDLVYYTEPGTVERLHPKADPLYHQARRLEKLPAKIDIVESGMKPFIGSVQKLKPTISQVTRADIVQDITASQKQTLRAIEAQVPSYRMVPRGKPLIPRLPLEVAKRRPRKVRGRFGGGWFIREHPIRLPTEMLGFKKRKRRKRGR